MKTVPLTAFFLLVSHTAFLTAQLDTNFSWLNPAPLGDDLNDAEWVAPGTFVAVSYNGFIFRSTDAGRSWRPVHHELRGALFSVQSEDGILVAGGQSGRTHLSTDGGKTWEYRKIPDYPYTVQDMHIFDRDRIVVVGSNLSYSAKIAYTRDGMKSWTIVNPDSSGYSFTGVDFVDDLNGWASGSPGVLLRTSDGGETWTKDTSSLIPGKALNAPAFRNHDTGVVAGDVGRILVTHDGGTTWSEQRVWSGTVFREAEWLDDSTIVLVGDGEQLRSTDAGVTWNEMVLGARHGGLGFGPERREGMAVGPYGTIVHTIDSGRTWEVRSRRMYGERILDLDFFDEARAVAVGLNGSVLYTRDSGSSWMARAIDPVSAAGGPRLDRVVHVTPDTVVALSGTVLYLSADGGHTWKKAYTNQFASLNDMFFLPDGTGWVVGDRIFLQTTDRGASWQELSSPTNSEMWAVYATDHQKLYITADGGRLYLTRNGGAEWTERHTNSSARFFMIHADESGRFITLGWEGGLFVTTGGGIFWEERRVPGNGPIDHFSFLSHNEGWAGQRDGPMLSTTDGGKTWSEHEHGIRVFGSGAPYLSTVELIRPGFGYLAGASGGVLMYREKGVSSIESEWEEAPEDLDLSVLERGEDESESQ